MAIAEIAYERLHPAAKEEAKRLVEVLKNVFPESSIFITASCWPDDLKSKGIEAFSSWHNSSLPFDPCGCLSEIQNQKICADLEGKDLLYAIDQCLMTLKHPGATDWEKGIMLRFLTHFVGDIHQPLHCTSLYDACYPEGDWGGNRFLIDWQGHKKSNLHGFWDSACGLATKRWPRPLDEEGMNAVKQLANFVTTQFPEASFTEKELNNHETLCWRQESFDLGKNVVYRGICPGQAPSSSYIENGQKVACKRIALAGYRLARLLNNTLKAS